MDALDGHGGPNHPAWPSQVPAERDQEGRSAPLLATILAAALDPLYVIDRQGTCRYVNPAGAHLLGLTPAALLGTTWGELGLSATVLQPVVAHWEQVVATGQPLTAEIQAQTGTGLQVYEYRLSPLWGAADEVAAVVMTVQEITARRQTEAALRASEERLRLLSAQVPAIVWTTDAQLHFTSGLGAGLAKLGLQPSQLQGVALADYFQTTEPTFPPLAAHRQALAGAVVSFEVVWAGRTYQAQVEPFRDLRGQIIGCIGVALDITARKAYEARLQHQAFHDPLTGLPNRAAVLERLEQALARAARHQTAVAVLFVDLDNFKAINDRLGHAGGDQVLMTMAERLRGSVRQEEMVARLGGDEFLILLEDIAGLAEARQVVARIAERLQAPVTLGEQVVPLSASIGLALAATGQEHADELLQRADAAMYRAKRTAKGGEGPSLLPPAIAADGATS